MEAFLVLLGTIIGGGITVWGNILNNKKEMGLKELEFELKKEVLKASNISDFRKEQILRYAKFSGSLQLVLGYLDDAIDICKQNRELSEQIKAIDNIRNHSDFEEAVKNLNLEMSWISIVSDSKEVLEGLPELEKEFDKFQTSLGEVKRKKITEDELKILINNFDQIKKSQRSLIKLLKEEVKK